MASEEAAPALSHWNAAKPGSTSLWPASPRWLNRYVEQLRTSHASSVITAARGLHKRLMQRD
jgi:hypothetical protein